MTKKNGYIKRLIARRQQQDMRDQAAFGIVGGALLCGIFGFRYLYVIGGPDPLWLILGLTGALLLLIGLISPATLASVSKKYRGFANYIGGIFFGMILSLIYYLLITPIGMLIRGRSGSAPFYSWIDIPPDNMEGWTDKTINIEKDLPAEDQKKTRAVAQPLIVWIYFVRYKRFVLLPALLILITVGLLMFFVASSTLAPFIYTLF